MIHEVVGLLIEKDVPTIKPIFGQHFTQEAKQFIEPAGQ
jgi:hypothetical protein